MKIIPSYISNINFQQSYRPAFTSEPIHDNRAKIQTDTLQEANKDYNVRVPISYKQLEDIKLSDDLTAKCYKLANGQRVVIVPKDGATVVKTYVNTGSFNEPDNLRGISHYIEHNLFNGSEELGDKVFFDEVNKMGANTNASTSFANTNYFISSNLLEDTDLENKIQLHAGMLQSPKFLLDKLEKEKKIVNSEINMCLSENENIGYTQTIKNLFNIKSSSMDLVAGSTDNITALTRDDVVNYFNNNYYPANMTTVITGEVEPENTIELVAKYFNSTKVPNGQRLFEKMIPSQKPVRQDIISQKSDSAAATVFIGFVGPENNNTKDKIYMQALSSLAGDLYNSRFSEIEREFGNVISISPERLSSRPEDKSLMMIEAEVSDAKSEAMLKKLYAVIDNLSKVPPTDDELTAIKNRMRKDRDRMLESSYGINAAIGNVFLNNDLNRLKDFNEIVENMTADDILNTAKKYFDLNKAALTVVHPNELTEDKIKGNYKKANSSAISFTGLNKKTPLNMDNISTFRTANNFDVVFNNAQTNTVQCRIAIVEPEWTIKKAAIADILSDMLVNAGTTTKSVEELSKEADILGISSGLFATDSGLKLSANFPVKMTAEAMEVFRDRIQNPNFTQAEFEKALRHIKDAYLNQEVNPFEKFNASVYAGTPLAETTKDMLSSLKDITLDDIKNYYQEIFANGQAMVVMTGPFDKNPELKQTVFDSLNKYSQVKPWNTDLQKVYSPIEKTEVFTDVSKKNQADIIEGFKFKYSGNIKDESCLALLNEILGGSPSSRLFMDLRESRHLAYSVSSNYNAIGDMGVFILKIGTTTENQETGEKTFENVQKSIDGFNENIKRITTERVTQEELDAAKKHIKSELLTSIELNVGKNSMIGYSKSTPYGVAYLNKQFENIDSITVDDIYNTANNIFNSKPIYSLTATKDTLDANKEYLNKLAD